MIAGKNIKKRKEMKITFDTDSLSDREKAFALLKSFGPDEKGPDSLKTCITVLQELCKKVSGHDLVAVDHVLTLLSSSQ